MKHFSLNTIKDFEYSDGYGISQGYAYGMSNGNGFGYGDYSGTGFHHGDGDYLYFEADGYPHPLIQYWE